MLPIPEKLKAKVKNRILSLSDDAERNSWESSSQEEDAITGQYFGAFVTNGWQNDDEYDWRIKFNKFRGRGIGAMEKKVGGDGMITIVFSERGITYYKSLVFQAKKEGARVNEDQVAKMKKYFPEGSLLVEYTSGGFFTEHNGTRKKFCKVVANDFLNCTIGIKGLYYDSRTNKIVYPNIIVPNYVPSNELIIEVLTK
jgi:hypothetical protein